MTPTKQIREWKPALLTVAFLLCGCSEKHVALTDTGIQLERNQLFPLDRHVWSTGVVMDGKENTIWVTGHDNGSPAITFTPSARSISETKALFPPGKDRHACTSADFNSDGKVDFFCSTGAERGSIKNPAELWLSNSEGKLIESASQWGVDDASARGRRVEAVDWNNDGAVDLITTAWSKPEQTRESRTKIWRNSGEIFDLAYEPRDATFGVKCLTTLDVNKDGFTDFLGCIRDRGMTLLVSQNGEHFKEFEANPFPNKNEQDFWWSLNTSSNSDQPLIAGIGGTRGKQFIALFSIDPKTLQPEVEKSFDCTQGSAERDNDIFCAQVIFTDVNGDQIEDLWVTRRLGWRHEIVTGDASELIVLGPDFERYVTAPPSELGATYKILPVDQGYIEVTSGEAWSGEVAWIAAMTPEASSETSPR